MTESIEAAPLDLSEEQAAVIWNFSYDVEGLGVGSAAVAIAMDVGRNTLLTGSSSTSHKEYSRRTGKCRRSIDTAIKRLKDRGVIERVGTSPDGLAVYVAPAALA